METWVQHETKFSGTIFSVRSGQVLLDDGSAAYREVVEHPGGVCVLPFDGRQVTLVRQYRIAVSEYVVEAVAGKLEPGDDAARRALVELEEEAGWRANRLVDMGSVFASVGFCSERIYLYLAMDLEAIDARPEPEERIELVRMEIDEVTAALDSNAFRDAKTVVLLERFLRWQRYQGMSI